MEPVEEALVKTCLVVHPHYNFSATEQSSANDEEENEYFVADQLDIVNNLV